MNPVILNIRKELKLLADEKTRESGKRFFKEDVTLYGVKTADVTRIARGYFKEIKGKGKEEIFGMCDALWQSGAMEESFIACDWAYALRKDYEPRDFKVFEKWVKEHVDNWASCDTLCNHTVGAFVEKYPAYVSNLKKWARSKNRWMRRAAAVSLIIPARRGMFLGDIFEIADILLADGDDLVQKGYGWMLKAASQAHLNPVHEYVMKNKAAMPRTALRYAIEKMPEKLKKSAMAK
ncbi:MAG: DNA alkylation repair protein [Spirochaetes bacterium]|nr:MAG: DNA alkylation repair protein [Spirochaetota bacterium]